MSDANFDPRATAEYRELIESGEFTADELEPLLAALPKGSTVGRLIAGISGALSFVAILPHGHRIEFEARDTDCGLLWRFYIRDDATAWTPAADAWGEWVGKARTMHSVLDSILAAVDEDAGPPACLRCGDALIVNPGVPCPVCQDALS